jgi:hypothetical protein
MYTNSLGGGNIYILVIECGGQDGTLWHSAYIYLGVDNSPSTETLHFLWDRNELINLINLTENSNLDNLQSKPGFSISNNTAAVDILLLKLRVT